MAIEGTVVMSALMRVRDAGKGAMAMAFAAPILLSAQIALAQTASDSPVTWKKQTYAKDHFEAEYSGPVKRAETDMTEATRKIVVRSTNYMQDDSVHAYIVTMSLYKNGVLFDKGVEANTASLHCKTRTIDRPVKFAEGTAREIEATGCVDGEYSAFHRFYTVGKEFFQILALFKPDGDVESAYHFVNSFHYIKN